MSSIRIANAPCSWGILEFDSGARVASPSQVLDEIASTGYAGTELGDFGFFPPHAEPLRQELAARRLAMVGAFVPVPLSDPNAHAAGEALATKTADLIRSVSGGTVPKIVLSDDTAAVRERTQKAGRITSAGGLSSDRWRTFAAGAERIARAVRDTTGLQTVFKHHCATYVETPEEIDELMQRTSPELLGLCLDTGHATYGGASALDLLQRYRNRVWHVHFKDCSPDVAACARREGWDYMTAVRRGLFCELGRGSVDFAALVAELRRTGYDGWIVVEQDVLPSMGTPAESAARNRRFLESLGI